MSNRIKDSLAAGKLTLGTWHSVRSIELAEAVAALGFDWIAIDMEHGAADVAYAEHAFIAFERHGVAPFVRMPEADPILARRLLDVGAHGLLVPVVEDAGRFAEFARHCFYPPDGRRGVALGRFNRWGDDFAVYMREFRPVLVPMIETRKGVAAADALAALPYVDALFFGPYDLSADLGDAGNFTTPAFHAALESVKASCAKHGKAAGGHQVAPVLTDLKARIAEGFRFLAFGTDVNAMRYALGGIKDIARK
jgi:2-keto-3-deoxy-L-rhamnonate aldolase RhmA